MSTRYLPATSTCRWCCDVTVQSRSDYCMCELSRPSAIDRSSALSLVLLRVSCKRGGNNARGAALAASSLNFCSSRTSPGTRLEHLQKRLSNIYCCTTLPLGKYARILRMVSLTKTERNTSTFYFFCEPSLLRHCIRNRQREGETKEQQRLQHLAGWLLLLPHMKYRASSLRTCFNFND